MAELPYMPLWTDAYLSDTDHLSFEEHGIYLKLLMLIWRTSGCQIPNDEGWICRRLRVSKTQFNELVKPLMEEFLDNTGNHITSRRLQHEFDESKKRSRKQSVRAKSRWNKEKGVCHGNASPAYATQAKQDTPPPQDNPPQKKTVSSNQLKTNNKDVCRGNASISIPISILKKDTTNVVSKEKPPKKRATRIDDSWQPSGKQFDFALTKLKTEERVRNEIEKFKNYYQAKSGEKAKSIIWDLTGYQMTKEVAKQDKDTAIKMLDKALEPLPSETILQELTRLKLKTMARNMTTEELSLQLAVYTDELGQYPADIVVKVLRDWPKQSKWWPTWHELDIELEWRTNRRQLKLDALIKGSSTTAPRYNDIINQAVKRI